MPSRKAKVPFSTFRGLDLSASKLHMDKGGAQVSDNVDYRIHNQLRVRAGYARIVSASAPTEIATDAFTEDFTPLSNSSSWTARGPEADDAVYYLYVNTASSESVRNTFDATATQWGGMEHTENFADDQYAQITMEYPTGDDISGLLLRSNATNAYFLYYDATNGLWVIATVTHATRAVTTLASNAIGSVVDGDTMRGEIVGSEIKLLHNGILVVNATDTTITTGKPGIGTRIASGATPAAGTFDNFAAGDMLGPVKVTDEPSYLYAFERDDEQVKIMVANGVRMDEFDAASPEWTS